MPFFLTTFFFGFVGFFTALFAFTLVFVFLAAGFFAAFFATGFFAAAFFGADLAVALAAGAQETLETLKLRVIWDSWTRLETNKGDATRLRVTARVASTDISMTGGLEGWRAGCDGGRERGENAGERNEHGVVVAYILVTSRDKYTYSSHAFVAV